MSRGHDVASPTLNGTLSVRDLRTSGATAPAAESAVRPASGVVLANVLEDTLVKPVAAVAVSEPRQRTAHHRDDEQGSRAVASGASDSPPAATASVRCDSPSGLVDVLPRYSVSESPLRPQGRQDSVSDTALTLPPPPPSSARGALREPLVSRLSLSVFDESDAAVSAEERPAFQSTTRRGASGGTELRSLVRTVVDDRPLGSPRKPVSPLGGVFAMVSGLLRQSGRAPDTTRQSIDAADALPESLDAMSVDQLVACRIPDTNRANHAKELVRSCSFFFFSLRLSSAWFCSSKMRSAT